MRVNAQAFFNFCAARFRFRRFPNRALLDPLRSSEMLARLRASTDSDVVEVVELIDEFGAGLEQEALLLKI